MVMQKHQKIKKSKGKVILRDEVTKVFDDSSNLSYQLYKKLIEAGAMELLEETNDKR